MAGTAEIAAQVRVVRQEIAKLMTLVDALDPVKPPAAKKAPAKKTTEGR